MKGTLANMREITKLANEAGLTIDKVVPGPHYKFYVTNKHGAKRVFGASSSPSDVNFMRVMERKIRHIANEHPTPTESRA